MTTTLKVVTKGHIVSLGNNCPVSSLECATHSYDTHGPLSLWWSYMPLTLNVGEVVERIISVGDYLIVQETSLKTVSKS